MKKYNIAILGATGLVGSTFLKILDEYQIPINNLRLFASKNSLGKKITFQGKEFPIEVVNEFSFKGIDFALFSAGKHISKKYAEQAIASGAIVIDNSSIWRMDPNVPLVVPEINISDAYNESLIANPNCSTIQAVIPLKALQNKFGIKSVSYTTYQAVSGSGFKGIKELEDTLSGKTNNNYPHNISKTCIPHIDTFLEDGYTNEEHKMINETKKILHQEELLVSATCVRVPVLNSHAVSINVILEKEFDLSEIYESFNNQKGIVVKDDVLNNIYPLSTYSNDNDNVYVGRIRKDKANKNGLLFYCTGDNIRKGAASNAVQIMQG
ncbi:MAG: aspartate-semialdehyde dehydrogenase, partial [Sulfurovum sp.]|nr:aspartate-semialdehyde dehydrogenase [Sulfurovum sp.]